MDRWTDRDPHTRLGAGGTSPVPPRATPTSPPPGPPPAGPAGSSTGRSDATARSLRALGHLDPGADTPPAAPWPVDPEQAWRPGLVIVDGNPLRGEPLRAKQPNRWLHAVLTLATGGLWLIVWVPLERRAHRDAQAIARAEVHRGR